MKTILSIALVTCGLMTNAQTHSKNNRSFHSPKQNTSAKTESVAPNSTYSFNTYTAPYQPITGTSLNNGKKWDEATFTVSLGFNFKLYSTQGTSIQISGGNGITFDDLNSSNSISIATPMGEDMCDRAFDPATDNEGDANGISNISYTTTGTAPNRVCHIEVNNAGFWAENDSLGTANNSFINYQIRLFETSNIIEFHYGNSSMLHPDLDYFYGALGFECALYDYTSLMTGAGTGNLLDGPFASPTMIGYDVNSSASHVISGQIQSGRVYQFLNTTTTGTYTAIRNNAGVSAVKLYPNPAKDKLTIESSDQDLQSATIELRDLTGRLVHTANTAKEINLPVLNQGVYFVKIRSEKGVELYNSKLIIAQ